MSKKNILIVVNEAIHSKNGGGIFYEQIKNELIDKHDLYYIFCSNRISATQNSEKIFNLKLRPPKSRLVNFLRKISPFEYFYKIIQWNIKKSKLKEFIQNINIDYIVFSLRGDSIFVSDNILKRKKIKSIGIIEDGIEREKNIFNFDFKLYKKLYEKLIFTCDSLFVISENMRAKYNPLNENIHVLRPYSNLKENFPTNNIDILKIVFAGSLYAINEINLFIKFLEKYSKENDQRITFKIIGSNKKQFNSSTIQIENYNWLDKLKLESLIKECNLSYLPYPFSKRMKETVKIAFPSKTALYLSYNLPIIFHGPENSSFIKFNEKYNVGISLQNNNYEEFEKKIALLTNKISLQKFKSNCRIAHKKEFSKEIFRKKLNSQIN